MRASTLVRGLSCVLFVLLVVTSFGQNQANWRLSNRFSPESLRPFVYSTSLTPSWIAKSDKFWYSWKDEAGTKFYIVNPDKKEKNFLFDSAKMAAMLSELLHKPYDTTNLPITTLDFDDKGEKFTFTVEKRKFEYTLATKSLKEVKPSKDDDQPDSPRRGRANRDDFRNLSPDKKFYVYAQDHNLYFVDVADEKNPVQLTKDGEKDYSFGNRDEDDKEEDGKKKDPRVRANVTWSPDSKTFFVQRYDMRKVADLYLVNSLNQPRPKLESYKYAMPGEENDGVQECFVFEPAKKELRKLDLNEGKYLENRVSEMQWLEDSKVIRFVNRDRTQRDLQLCDLDLATMKCKPLITEKIENGFLERQPIRYFKKKDGDFVWWSERDGWGHLYLYDHDGKLKNRITEGPWRVDSIAETDEDKRIIYFVGVGREPGEHSSYKHLYRVDADGKHLELLDAGRFDHTSRVSPTKKYIVDVCSRVDAEPRAIVMDGDGRTVMELEKTDCAKLYEWGWKAPEMFVVKSADGVTDIEGVMWKPLDFNPAKQYPIIANVYPGPQTESVTTTFSPTSMCQRLANLGFIVVQIGNRGGNPRRSNAYHSYGYFNLRDYALADKKAGIEQLAVRYPWIDIDRVGIYGHSGGGFLTAAALLLPPYNDFFKVGVSSSGNHDNNIYNANWSEQHHGLKEVEVKDKDGKVTKKYEIKVPTNAELAANLKGDLLLVHGDMDNNVHPAGTIRLMDALIKANKRFDFILMPGQQHGYGSMTEWFNQRLMEYFAEHLLGDKYGSAEMKEKR
jgi:dipeptidyl aminopeptidase/acylaminoacyl peptidase